MSTLTGRDTSFGEMFKRAKRRAYLLRADVS
jgi:hypothetical protein